MGKMQIDSLATMGQLVLEIKNLKSELQSMREEVTVQNQPESGISGEEVFVDVESDPNTSAGNIATPMQTNTPEQSDFQFSGYQATDSAVNQSDSQFTFQPTSTSNQQIPISPISVVSGQGNGQGNGRGNGHGFRPPNLNRSGNQTIPPSQIFPTTTWRPKEPPVFHGKPGEDVHNWIAIVRNYFAFMQGFPQQEVAYAVQLLRDSAQDWWAWYLKVNGGRYPPDWPTMAGAMIVRFGSNMRAQMAQAHLMFIKQGKRSVREYAADFESNMGRLESYDEGMLLNMFIWGLQPQLAQAVSMKYPQSISQAIGYAETIELAIRTSQRPSGSGGSSGSGQSGNNQDGRGGFPQRGGGRGGRWQRGVRGGIRGGFRGIGRGVSTSRNRRRDGGQTWTSTSTGNTGIGNTSVCYTCGAPGHLSRNCPKNVSSKGGRNTKTQKVKFAGMQTVWDEHGNEYQMTIDEWTESPQEEEQPPHQPNTSDQQEN